MMTTFKLLISLISISFLISLTSLTYSTSVMASRTGQFCKNIDLLGKLPIQQAGRVKPLIVHANSLIKHLTHSTNIDGKSAIEIYCLLSFQGFGIIEQDQGKAFDIKARIDHVKLQKFLDLTPEHRKISYAKLVDLGKDIRMEMRKTPEGSYQKALMTLVSNISIYQELRSGQNWFLPNLERLEDGKEKIVWLPLTQSLTPEKIQKIVADNPGKSPIQTFIKNSAKNYQKLKGDKHILEYKYYNLHLPVVALILTLIALLVTTISNKSRYFLTPIFITLTTQTVYIIFRIIISGRAPITNMYETVMFSGFGALIFSILIGHFKKEKIFLITGLIYNAITLMMMLFASGMLHDEIHPLVPVLRDNFWLSTHVTCLLLSYGSFALSWILSNIIIIKKSFYKISKREELKLNDLIYTILKFGTTLLAAGIILGGVWADYSWGRFWGWDPKETWSLIVLCIYIAILHGRSTSWIPAKRFAPLTAGAFLSVMMAWFGVNYILATGLHSYGFSQGGAIFLAVFYLTQISVLIFTHFKSKKMQA